MKRLSLIVLGLLTIIIKTSFAAIPLSRAPFEVSVPSLYGGLHLDITALHWETTTNQYDYALSYPLTVVRFQISRCLLR